jgi:uncharacterized protein YoxC
MATMCFAMWLQESDFAGTNRLIMIFIGLIALAIVGMAIVMMVISVKALRAVKDFGVTAEEFKKKLLPLVDELTGFSRSGRQLLEDSAPKLKLITENLVKTSDTLVEASKVARSAVQHIDATISDANMRTQRQVARVDGMFTTALDTTAEVVETINHGIRVPAQKIAGMAAEAKYFAEGLLAKVKAMSANLPFGSRKETYRP